MKTFKRSLYLLSMSLFIYTHANAENDLNTILTGTYAVNTNWVCTAFDPNIDPTILIATSTSQVTTRGEITYFGDGTATEFGSSAVSIEPNPLFGPIPFNGGDIGTYTCEWTYQVNNDPLLDCSDPSTIGLLKPVTCDARYEGTCQVTTVLNPAGFTLIDQVWFIKIGRKGDGRLGNGKTSDIILIDRHDGNPERVFDDSGGGDPSPFSICGKTGTQVKIRGALPQE